MQYESYSSAKGEYGQIKNSQHEKATKMKTEPKKKRKKKTARKTSNPFNIFKPTKILESQKLNADKLALVEIRTCLPDNWDLHTIHESLRRCHDTVY